MALTDSATERNVAPASAPPPRRSLLGRLSLGHVVMILAGLLALLLNLAFLRSGDDVLRVVIAARDLAAGEELLVASFEIAEVGDIDSISGGLLTEPQAESLVGSRLARAVARGEPLRPSDLRPATAAPGLREMSIDIDSLRAVGDRLKAGDLVDVIATVDDEARYVVTGIEVIEILGTSSSFGGSGEFAVVVAVDDGQALEIAAAMSAGSLDLVRSTGAPSPSPGITGGRS